jgi:hypothetical protein
VNLNKHLPSNIVKKIQFKNALKLQLQINIVNNNLWNILTVSIICTKFGAVNVVRQTGMWFLAVMICTVHEMAWITNTRQSQTSSEENGTNIPDVRSCEPDHGLQLELIFGTCHWFKLTIQHTPPLLTGVAIWLTLDVGLVPCSEDVPFEGIFSWCQVWSRFVCSRGQELSKLIQQKAVSFFYSIHVEDKRAYRRDIFIIFLYAKCCERLIAIFYQVLHFRFGDTLSYSILTGCTVTSCKYMCC